MTTAGSLFRLNEFCFEPVEAGVPGVPLLFRPLRPNTGSELCLRRDKLNRFPRLPLAPMVDVEVLVDWGRGGVGKFSSSMALRTELNVEDLPLIPSPFGRPLVPADLSDRCEALESLRRMLAPGAANIVDAATSLAGEVCSSLRLLKLLMSELSARVVNDWRTGDSEGRPPVDSRGVLAAESSADDTLGGNGNKGPLLCFRRGKRKNVVVVDTVCVVVVVANTP